MAILEYNALDNCKIVNYKELRNKIFKLLPIYEGKTKGSDIKIDVETAYNNFKNNLNLLCVQIDGIINEIEIHKNMLDVLVVLKGLKNIEINNHDVVKSAILHCVNLIETIGG